MSTQAKNLILSFLFIVLLCPAVSYGQGGGWMDSLNLSSHNSSGSNATLNDKASLNNTADLNDPNSDLFKKAQTKATGDIFKTTASLGNNNSTGKSSSTCNNKFKTFADVLNFVSCFINTFLIQIAITLALIYFMWGVVQYVLSSDSAEERKKSKQVMFWGVIGIFVIVSVWGIILAFKNLFGF